MVRIGMVVMQKFGGNAICPGYNVKEYEKRRGERIEKPRVESERYYTPPSIESDFDCCMQVRKTHQSMVRHTKEERNKNSDGVCSFEYYQPTPQAEPQVLSRASCMRISSCFILMSKGG